MLDNLTEFLKKVQKLDSCEKAKISEITELADKFRNDKEKVQFVCNTIISYIEEAKDQMKLGYFYVMDSILKNKGGPFNKCFADHLVTAFVNSFKSCTDRELRKQFHKLRSTWSDGYFPDEVLKKLDASIRCLDPNWPILTNKRRSDLDDECEIPNKILKTIETDTVDSDNKGKVSSDSKPLSILDFNITDEMLSLVNSNFVGNDSVQQNNKVGLPIDNKENRTALELLNSLDSGVLPSTIFNRTPEILDESDVDGYYNMTSTQAAMEQPTISSGSFPMQNMFINDKNNNIVKINHPAQFLANNMLMPPISAQLNVPVNQPPPPVLLPSDFGRQSRPLRLQFDNNLQHSGLSDNNGINNLFPEMWRVNIKGFPQMPQIGTDPRLLCPLAKVLNPPNTVTISNQRHIVILDRLQPCTIVNNTSHAVRFACNFVWLSINNDDFKLATNLVNQVTINKRPVSLCIGGPFHEIIIDGIPYNVNMTGEWVTHRIYDNLIRFRFKVRRPFPLRMMPTIPLFIMKWAEEGFFGKPYLLNRPPLNPLMNSKLQDPIAAQFRAELMPNIFGSRPEHPRPMQMLISSAPPPMTPQYNPIGTAIPISTTDTVSSVSTKFGAAKSESQIIVKSENITDSPVVTNKENRNLCLSFQKFDIKEFEKPNLQRRKQQHINDRTILQCDQCSCRFRNSGSDVDTKTIAAHMDYHFFKNATGMTDRVIDRQDFVCSKSWIVVDDCTQKVLDDNHSKFVDIKQTYRCPKSEGLTDVCPVCNESFVDEWDNESECFMLLNAVRRGQSVYHPICEADVDKRFKDVLSDSSKLPSLPTGDPIKLVAKLLKGDLQLSS